MLGTFFADASTTIQQSAALACAPDCSKNSISGILKNVTTTLIFVIAALSVLMIIVGGLRYVISGGDPKKTADAKNTIFYAVIGLVVSMLSYAIIKFVVTTVK